MKTRPLRMASLLCSVGLALGVAACGGGGGGGDGHSDALPESFPVAGTLYYAPTSGDAKVPHIFSRSGELSMLYQTGTSFVERRLTSGTEQTIDVPLNFTDTITVTDYSVSENGMAWSQGGTASYYSPWLEDATLTAQTTNLVPGVCLTEDAEGARVMLGLTPSGKLMSARVNVFEDSSHMTFTSLIDPDKPSGTITAVAFACSGKTGFAATSDGRLLQFNTTATTPELTKLVSGQTFASFPLLQYTHPYIIWVDSHNDIRAYNLADTKRGAYLAVNVDPVGTMKNTVADVRLFGNLLLWSDDSEGNYNIWAANLDTMADENDYVEVTNAASDQRYPFYYAGVYYWQDNRNGKWEIWSYDSNKH